MYGAAESGKFGLVVPVVEMDAVVNAGGGDSSSMYTCGDGGSCGESISSCGSDGMQQVLYSHKQHTLVSLLLQ